MGDIKGLSPTFEVINQVNGKPRIKPEPAHGMFDTLTPERKDGGR